MKQRPSPEPAPSKPPQNLLVPRLLATLISLTLVGLGLLAVLTEHYYGRTNKYGGAEISIDGAPAIAMGVSIMLFGLFPLGLWFRTSRPAVIWILACFAAAGVVFFISIKLR